MGRIAKQKDRTQTLRLDQLCAELAQAQPAKVQTDLGSPTAIVMVGVPCSGKSTYVKTEYSNYTLISRDAQVMACVKDEVTYNEAWKIVNQKRSRYSLRKSSFRYNLKSRKSRYR